MRELTIGKNDAGVRLDRFVSKALPLLPPALMQKYIRIKRIKVNGARAQRDQRLAQGDVVQLYINDEFFDKPSEENLFLTLFKPQVDVVYEDENLLLVNKPAGMVVHPGHGNYSATLVNALTYYLQNLPLFQEGDMRAGLVHRIDKNTSGLLVIAKNERAHARLAKQFFDHTITRRYVALVWGNFEEDEGTITGNIGRSPKDRQKMWVFEDGSDGKHAVTHYRVLKRYGYVTLIECRLETGRTHQIRVHMQWKGHPLFGDERYGGDRILKGTTFNKYKQFIENCFAAMPRQALHAKSLGFQHPTTGEQVYFESELPEDFRTVLAKWDAYAAAGLAEE